MMVYRTPTRVLDTSELAQIADPVRLLVEFGEVEAALVDEQFPERDGLCARLTLRDLPRRRISVPTAEGYAYYGLFPETYAESARRFWREVQPVQVVVLGLRGIGTSLSRVVQEQLEQRGVGVHSFTVRPRGNAFDRELRITAELADRWRSLGHAHFAIVDEGPGLSGSSFCGAARKLSELGIPDERIVFFPSWEGDADAFQSEDARRRWGRHRKYWTDFDAGPGLLDLSAGQWRTLLYPRESEYPETVPQHEARKYLQAGVLRKFAGLGPYGEVKWHRAQALADAGFSPRAIRLADGFLESEFVPDTARGGRLEARATRRLAEYFAFRARHFATGETAQPEPLAEMIETNLGIQGLPLPDAAPAVIVDGRLLQHEWVGVLKTDALDHGDNHFFPGPTDIAWDLAGAKIELGMDVTDEYARLSGDCHVARRLPFYTAAYQAFRQGYKKMFGLTVEASAAA